MHISDGVLPAPIWLAGLAAAGAAAAVTSRRMDERRIPEVAVLTSVFFAASLIHVPLGVASAHLLLTGLLGIILGRFSVAAVVIALFFQAVLFGHGGLTTLGVNALTMSSGALGARVLFLALRGPPAARRRCLAAAFLASLGGSVISALVFLGVMATAGSASAPAGAANPLLPVAVAILVPHVLFFAIDAAVCASAAVFLLKVKPELLPLRRMRGSPAPGPRGPGRIECSPPPPRSAAARAFLAAALGALSLGAPRAALAHALEAIARVEDGFLKVEAFYSDDTPVRGARVEARLAGGDPAAPAVAAGVTDASGFFRFRFDGSARLLITVDDGAGHRASLAVPAARREGDGAGSEVVADSRGRWLSGLGPAWARALAGVAAIAVLFAVARLARARRRRRAA